MSGSVRPDANLEFDPFAGPVILETAPSTEPQREIWTAAQGGIDSSLCFNESITLRFRGPLDVGALTSSFARVVGRHEALRTTFSGDGLTLCISAPGVIPEASVLDFRGLEAGAQTERFHALLKQEAETPFDLERGPLFRVHYVRVAEEELRVVLTAHHIVCDGWSTAVIIKDWAQFYNAQAAGRSPEFTGAEAFSAYAREQLSGLHGSERAADEAYWLKQFTGELPVLELPYDRPRPHAKTFVARRYDGLLPPDLVQSLKKAGAKSKASLFTTLLAGFKALLFRLSNQEDVVVGIPAAGQAAAGRDSLVGHCVNMLPLRSKLDANLPFSELLSSLRTSMLDAYDHQQYTFGTLLSKLPIARDPSRLPLVSVVFNVDRGLTSEAMGFEGLEVECLTNPRHFENFDIFLNAVELPTGVVLECQYNTDLFDEVTVRRWLSAYEQLLLGVVQEPTTVLGLLPLLSPEERAQLARFNAATRAAYPADLCVHQLIEAQVDRNPDAVACQFEGVVVSYAEINRRANQLARRLRSLGVSRGSLVGLSVERSPRMLVGLLGILKSGAAYVPLDPGYPLDRLSFMVEDSRMTVLVTESTTRTELNLPARDVVLLDSEADPMSQEDDSNLPHTDQSSTPADTAYVIYTSGSTGKPKGVLVSQGGVVNLLTSVQKTPGMNATDVVLAVTTLSFDIAVSELVLPLTVGAKIVIVSRDVASDGARLLEAVTSSRVTFMDATPATYRLLLGAGWTGDPNLTLICTGEAMPLDLAHELVKRARTVWNGYGPTETTVWSTFYRVKEPIERILIGTPVQNTQVYILDSKMQERPIGVPGEIYIAGAGVASGYLNRPDLSQERFLPDPFSDAPNGRMYRTGDLGRYLKNGDLECLGRNDTQIKLRGYRIELGEIENALGQHSLVRQGAVIVREDRPGDARLVAYVVFHPGSAAKDSELRAHLKHTLPDYMVPATYVFLETMPLTPSGKIDRKALPPPGAAAITSDSEFVPPRTATEKLIAELWQEALSVPRVSIQDDFFALGGHSLLASQVLARLRRDHGIQLSFRKIFEAPTIAQLAVLVDGDAGKAQAIPEDRLVRRTDASPAPLSVSQERLWLLEEMDPSERLVHCLPAAWRLEGKVNPVLLQRALDEIARRHETLRTTISLISGKPVQTVASSVSLPIEQIDLADHPSAAARAAALADAIAAKTRETFDLGRGPLFRSYLFRLAENDFVYLTLRHNIIWDGWSFDVFLAELTTLYGALESGATPVLPELPISYSDYVVWHRGFLEGPEIARQIDWWRATLADVGPELALPSDRRRPGRTEHAGSNLVMHFSRTEADALTALGRASNATLFMVVFAAYVATLHRYTGQTDILVGTPVRARNRPEVENLLGPFINAVVLRTKIDPNMTFGELLLRVRDTTLDSFSNQDMPLERLGSRPPVLRSFFSFQDARTRSPSLGTVPVSQMHVEPPAAANDLMLWMMDTRSELLAVINYSTELFDPDTVERFLGAFAALLRVVVADPAARVGEIPLALPEALALTHGFGEPAGTFGPSLTARLDRMTKEHATRTAVTDGVLALSYDELGRRVSGLAQWLAEKAPGPGKLVALYAPSAIDRVVGLLGALTAGIPFVVLDPSFPAARNLAICEHLSPGCVLAGNAVDVPANLAPVVLHMADAVASETAGSSARPVDVTDAASVMYRFDGEGRVRSYPVSFGTLSEGVAAVAGCLELGPGSLVVGLSTPSADLALFEILAPLSTGAELLLPGSQQRLDRMSHGRTIDRVLAPPSAWARMTATELRTLNGAVFLGEPSFGLCDSLLREKKSVFRLEAFKESGFAPFVTRIAQAAEWRCIGRPRFPSRVAIRAQNLALLPAGVPGDLYAESAAAPAGNGRAPAAGAERTLAPTFARARFRGEGVLELLGARDHSIELHGHRFAPAEIASLLEGHASIHNAIVLLAAPRVGLPKLAAYLVVRPGAVYTETELRKHLRQAVPDFMVPQVFVEVDAIPMTGSGEVDFARLPSAFGTDDGVEYAPPRSDSERLLSDLFARALGLPRVGLYDNFFDLGGQSLLCFEVIGEIERRTGRRISPRVMLLGSLEQVAVDVDGGAKTATPSVTRSSVEPERTHEMDRSRAEAETRGGLLGGRLFKKLKGLVRGS
jgi:amino acid adenylation domain-containing protein